MSSSSLISADVGDDTFVIRSFLALRIVGGEVQASDNEGVKASGGDDADYFEIGDTVTSYVVNAGVDVDGGTVRLRPASVLVLPRIYGSSPTFLCVAGRRPRSHCGN